MMKIDITIIILYELENDHKSVKKYRFPISHFLVFYSSTKCDQVHL